MLVILMDKAIGQQIKSYRGKTYTSQGILHHLSTLPFKDLRRLLVVVVKDNSLSKVTAVDQDMGNIRIEFVVHCLRVILKRKRIPDTVMVFNLYDGYYTNTKIPVFSLAIPKGIPGLISPNYDIFKTPLDDVSLSSLRQAMTDFEPPTIMNDIYFIGANTSTNNGIRELLSKEGKPFNVRLVTKGGEPLTALKTHKYLLDLPGFRPWSVRNKFLFLTGRVIIRISFFNSKYNEQDFYVQAHDYVFEEGQDYVHLKYDVDHFEHLTPPMYNKIRSDIIKVYTMFESKPHLYQKMTQRALRKSRKLTEKNTIRYFYTLLKKYTEYIIRDG